MPKMVITAIALNAVRSEGNKTEKGLGGEGRCVSLSRKQRKERYLWWEKGGRAKWGHSVGIKVEYVRPNYHPLINASCSPLINFFFLFQKEKLNPLYLTVNTLNIHTSLHRLIITDMIKG